jgi:hypothetical protein
MDLADYGRGGARAIDACDCSNRWTVLVSPPRRGDDGVMNALTIETDTVREITIVGPGAGQEQAGQVIFADLVHLLRAT